MKYNIRRWNPILISIPDIGIGMMWGSLGNVVAFFGYTFTNSAADIAKIYSLAAIVGVFTQVIVGVLSDKTQHKWGKRSPWLVFGMVGAALSVTLWPLANSFTMFLIMTGVTCTLVNVAQCAYYTMVMEVVDADQVGYLNAHGTSTPLGDVNETNAIKAALGDHAKKIVVNSTKSMTGHLLGGAGGIESVFTALAVHHQKSPPTINIFNQDPECDLDYCANTARDMKIDVALKNNFGFGGTNGALVFKRV